MYTVTYAMRTKSQVGRPRPPADFEEVKRRFIRQNRELAKNNSTQSLRIRSLELEVSRLLADNLELRNRVLQVQNELHASRWQASTTTAVLRVKEELQAKIVELSGIVDGIEDMREHAQNGRRDSGTNGERRALAGNWRERLPLSELMRESQMPTIAEDKLYPRRTIGAAEIQTIRLSDNGSTGSPDLGPPPVARFDYEDPVKTVSPLVDRTSPVRTAPSNDDDLIPASLSINLETRKKRRDGQPKLEIRRHSVLGQSPGKGDVEASSILRTGAKRKLSDREAEKPIRPPGKGDFAFVRKVAPDESKTANEQVPVNANTLSNADTTSKSPAQSSRKVLGEKSVNMSPRKTVTAEKPREEPDRASDKQSSDDKPATVRPTTSRRHRRISSIPLPTALDEVVLTTEFPLPTSEPLQGDPPPQTPAALDLFSPTPSEPSARQPEGRGDTPPPDTLISTRSTADSNATRPSRRARSAVNYAEPSLMAKMRRPDKKMVDALTGLQDPRRAMNASSVERRRQVEVKQEPLDDDDVIGDDAWKSLPSAVINDEGEAASPLSRKSETPPTTLAPTLLGSRDMQSDERLSSASTATSSASSLATARQRRRQSTTRTSAITATADPTDSNIGLAASKLSELDLYDFKESSSPLTDSSSTIVVAAPARQLGQRRHSLVPGKDTKVAGMDLAAAAAAGGGGGGRKPGGLVSGERTTAAAASRRRSMLL